MKHMDLGEFQAQGYLFEANRRFFHPLGLALELTADDGIVRLSGIQDYRDDPEGVIFDEIDSEDAGKATAIQLLWDEKAGVRLANLGYVVQPMPDSEARNP